MSNVIGLIGGALVGFALGSVPFGYLLVRWKTGGDVRRSGSGNIGATNVGRALGKAGFLATLALDGLKGAAGVGVATFLGLSVPWAAFGAVVGHCYTPWLGGQGGKGVATLLGAFSVASPVSAAVATLAVGLGAAATRMVSAGSLLGSASLAAAAWWRGEPRELIAAAGAAAVVIWWRHQPNIRRILAGEERKIGATSR